MAVLLLRGRFQEALHQHSQQTCPLLLFYSRCFHPRRWRHLEPPILSSKNPQLPLYIPYLCHARSHSLYGSTSDSHHNQSSVYHPCLHPQLQKNTPESSNHISDFPCKAWHSTHRMWPLFYRWGLLSVSWSMVLTSLWAQKVMGPYLWQLRDLYQLCWTARADLPCCKDRTNWSRGCLQSPHLPGNLKKGKNLNPHSNDDLKTNFCNSLTYPWNKKGFLLSEC